MTRMRQRSRRLLMISSGSYNSTLTIRLRYLAQSLAKSWNIVIITPPADKYNGFKADRTLKLSFARLVQPWQLTTRNLDIADTRCGIIVKPLVRGELTRPAIDLALHRLDMGVVELAA